LEGGAFVLFLVLSLYTVCQKKELKMWLKKKIIGKEQKLRSLGISVFLICGISSATVIALLSYATKIV